MSNEDLAQNFKILTQYYNDKKDIFRSRAYDNAYKIIKNHSEITNVSQVRNIKGIGKTITEKIQEFLDTGKIEKVEQIKDQINNIHPFEKIFGVGPVKSKKLQELGYNTIKQLKKNTSILTKQQQIGLKYYYELLEKIPRIKIHALEIIIMYFLNKKFGKTSYTMNIAGSYRRGKKFSGDMDILITSDQFNLSDIVQLLQDHNIITDILSMKETKFMGIAKSPGQDTPHFRLDIQFLPKEEYPTGLLYFTGSKEFNMQIRQHAKKKGFLLNEHGLFKQNQRICITTEKDLFDKLDLEYLKPEERL